MQRTTVRGFLETKAELMRLENRHDGSDGVLLSLVKHAMQPLPSPLSEAVGEACAAALLPPEASAEAPGCGVVLSRLGCPPHAQRKFSWDEPACRLRRWAEAATPGGLASSPKLRLSAAADGMSGELLSDGPGITFGEALTKGGHLRGAVAFLVVLET